jgi:hypothetical protein
MRDVHHAEVDIHMSEWGQFSPMRNDPRGPNYPQVPDPSRSEFMAPTMFRAPVLHEKAPNAPRSKGSADGEDGRGHWSDEYPGLLTARQAPAASVALANVPDGCSIRRRDLLTRCSTGRQFEVTKVSFDAFHLRAYLTLAQMGVPQGARGGEDA